MHDGRPEDFDAAASRGKRFRELAEPELANLYRLARRLMGNEAEDVVQDCLLNAFRSLEQLQCDDAAPAWLRRILVNCCRDRQRRIARQPQEVGVDDIDDFSLYRTIADADPYPYSDSVHLDFLD